MRLIRTLLLCLLPLVAFSQQRVIQIGPANAHQGESAFAAFNDINANFSQLFAVPGASPIPAGNILCNSTGGAAFASACGSLPAGFGVPTTNLTGALQAAQEPAHTGDCTNSAGSLALNCTKTGGVAFAASATSDTTNANNISSGTLPAARIPATAVTASSYGDGTHVGAFTVGADGRLTAASSVAITGAAPTGATGGDLAGTFPNPTIAVGAVTDAKSSLEDKPSVGLVATSNLTLSGAQTVDGVAGTAGQTLVLATAQSTASQNGPWIMQSGAWTRPVWYPSGGTTQAVQFATTFIRLGTTYQGSVWRLTTAAPITIDTTATTWAATPLALNSQTVGGAGLPLANIAPQATGTILGAPSVTIAGVSITGTAGQFAFTGSGLAVGQFVTLTGTYGGTGSITGYTNPTTYYVSATNGTSTFTLQTIAKTAIVTTAGTPTGLTYSSTAAPGANAVSNLIATYAVTAAETAAGFTPTNAQAGYEPYDLRRYGAVGDNATDNTAAINTWISVCQFSGTCFVYPGIYKTTGNHSITARFSIIGRGGGEYVTAQPKILLTANAANLFNWNGLNNAGPTISGMVVSGVTFDGGNFTLSDALIALQGATLLTFRDVGLHNVVGSALRLRQMWDSQFENVMWRNIDAHSTSSGVINIDSVYNSDVNQNVNNLSLRRVHFEGNKGTQIYSASDSNLNVLRVNDSKFEAGSGSLVGGPYPLFNLKQADTLFVNKTLIADFRNALGYNKIFKLGDTSAGTSAISYDISGNLINGTDTSTYYVDTEAGSSGKFADNMQDDNVTGLVLNTSSRAARFEYPMKTLVQSDGSQTFYHSQNALSGFVGVDRLANSSTSFTQDSTSLSTTKNVVVSPSSASSTLVSLPVPPFTGMMGVLRVGVRCFSATGAGTLSLQYNTTVMAAVACPTTAFGTITFDVPQAGLAALTTGGSNHFWLTTGAANAEAVTVDGVYFQQVPSNPSTAAESFGASPSASAAANQTAINTALAVGGLVTITTPGTYSIACVTALTTSDSNTYHLGLVIPSNTHFRLENTVVLKCAGGVNNPVLIQNSNIAGGNTNIYLEGGTYDENYAANTISHVGLNAGTGSWTAMILWMQNITNLTARGMTLQNGFAGFGINHVTSGWFEDIHCNDSGTNFGNNQGSYMWPAGANIGLHFKNIYGQTNDDMIGLISDFGADARFTNLMGGPGPITDIIIDGVHGDTTNGTLNFVRVGPSTTTNPISRVQISNVTGSYVSTAIKIGSFGYSATGQINDVQIRGLTVTPTTAGNTGTATIDIENNTAGTISSLTIDNFNASIPSGVTQKPFFKMASGTLNRLLMSNLSFFDKNTVAGSLQDISIVSTVNSVAITNFQAQSAVSAGDGAFVTVGSTTNPDTVHISNGYTVRRKNLLSVVSSASIGKSVSINNVTLNLPQAPSFSFATTGSIPFVNLNGVTVTGTGGAALGFISESGVTGTTLYQMQGVITNQGASANIVRAGAEAIRVQSMDTPVPNAVLACAVGDIILDSSNSNNPYRCSTAPSTWTAL